MTDKECVITTIRNNPGIFYEAIGEMRTSEITWKMIIYVDLTNAIGASLRIQNEIDATIEQCNNTSQICNSQRQLATLTNKLRQVEYYLNHIQELSGETRIRRAPLEFIGQISKILFGTLTTEDAYYINAAIMHVENKTNDLAALLINQTTATRTRFGELYNATLKIRTQLTQLNQHVQNKINNLGNQIVRNKIQWEFEHIIESIDMAILEHEIDLNIIIDAILFGKQGLIHPRMISPRDLMKNSMTIKEQIPHAEFPVLINEQEMNNLIKMSNLRIVYSDNRLIYILHIPLLTPGTYKIYKPIPLPARQEFDSNKYAIVTTDVKNIGLNEDADSFYEFYEGELKECTALKDTIVCPAIFPLKKIRQTPSCNIELLLNRKIEVNRCEIIIKELKDTYWKALTTPGNWIYSTVRKERIRVECRNYDKQFDIENSGIITIQQGCKIRAPTATMSHPSTQATKFLQYYVPLTNLSILNLYRPIHEKYEINLTEATQELWASDHSNVEATFEDIIEKARQIKDRRTQYWQNTAYNAIACSTAILGTLALIAFFAYRTTVIRNTTNRIYEGCCRKKKESEGPTPHPSAENKNPVTEPSCEQSEDRRGDDSINPST